ncbi:3-oxoacid CoA-transferase subunit B [Aeromicrobium sp. Leaf350]|uniref:3-oxoacid CoA-transferase subunit B n=1 Tax=Aeromicrobium sp. Leaf350 TaxID=2876565 RepID=UPI00271502BE|nr:3-oxoacid CoA-transferase subunit B [Aeromicrobium sp. Leaf350]
MSTAASRLTKDQLAARIAADIPRGSYVNLGIGQPTLVADHLDLDSGVVLHTENGMLGMGRAATGDEIDPDLTNAGKVPVIETPGCSYFHHADSFAMMRGGHLDVCVLGAFQVSETGDLANWHTGAPDSIPAVGGAMDLAVGAKEVLVMMTLFGKDGRSKLVPELTYPATGLACVSRVYTDHGVFEVRSDGLLVIETFGCTVAGLMNSTGLALRDGPRWQSEHAQVVSHSGADRATPRAVSPSATPGRG